MHKFKYLLIIFFISMLSFLLSAAIPSLKKDEYNLEVSINIPSEHRIEIINQGQGSILMNNIKINNGEIIICKRFSTLTFTITPDYGYEIDKITLNNNDITSSITSNTISLKNITKDGTLKVYFKNINNIPTYKKLIQRISPSFENIINSISTGDPLLFSILTLGTLIIITLIYTAYNIFKK